MAAGATTATYRRRLPNALSRLVECLRPLSDDDRRPLLVLGDVPLRTRGPQTVFVHNTHVLAHQDGASRVQAVKFAVMRAVFRSNLSRVTRLVVQTELMARELVAAYPVLEGYVRVVRQPPPTWLLDHVTSPRGPRTAAKVRLFYPAAGYPHKNHRLIAALAARADAANMVEEITVTLPESSRTDESGVVRYAGRLDPAAMRERYASCDALFFPSLSESYGLPLVEAMWLGLPIVCADLPYAHELCGDQAIYFDPRSPAAASAAIATLRDRLMNGWQPDWSDALSRFPRDWDAVARRLVAIATDPNF